MTFSVTPLIGIDLMNVTTAANIASGAQNPPGLPGTEVFGSDGKIYVLAKANGAIASGTAASTVNAGTFLATGSGGTYLSPAVAMVAGDYGWFAKASV